MIQTPEQVLQQALRHLIPMQSMSSVKSKAGYNEISAAISCVESAIAALSLPAAAPEAQPAEPVLVMTGYQLRAAAEFVNPDPGDTDQLESEVCIQWGPARDDGEGGTEPAGLRVWLADYPEEGSMALDPDKPWPPAELVSGLPAAAVPTQQPSEVLVLLIEHDGTDSPSVALARNRAELLEQVKVAVWGEPHPADTTNDAGDDMAEGMTDTLLETGVMAFEGDPPLRLVRIPVEGWFASPAPAAAPEQQQQDIRDGSALSASAPKHWSDGGDCEYVADVGLVPMDGEQVVAAAPSALPSAPAAAPGVPAQHWKERHEKVAEWAHAVFSNKLHPINMAHMVHALYYRAPTGGEAEQLQTELTDEQMRAEFMSWVRDRGCDTDGAWSAWQGCWKQFASHLAAPQSVRTSGEALGTVPSAQGWRPIETAPKDGAVVLLNDLALGGVCIGKWLAGDEWAGWIYDDDLLADNNPLGPQPTLWMPLPPVPGALAAASPEVLPASPDVQDPSRVSATPTDGGNQ